MRSLSRCSLLAVLVLVLGVPATARAGDLCFNVAGSTLVLKAFTLPAKGACKDARGFFLVSDVWWLDGMACGSSDGTHVTVTQTVNLPDDFVESFFYTIDRATLSGTLRQCVLDTGNGGGCVAGIALNKIACNPSKVPVP